MEWIGAHVYFRDGSIYGSRCDAVIVDAVAPIARKCIDRGWAARYFFLRYSEAGPHVRLRLLASPDTIEGVIRPTVETDIAAAGGVSLRWVPYVPEIERYGGESAMPLVERAFHASSDLALALIPAAAGSPHSARLGGALMAMTVLLHVFAADRGQAVELTDAFSTGYRRVVTGGDDAALLSAFDAGYSSQQHLSSYVDDIWERLSGNEPTVPPLDAYHASMCDLREALHAVHDRGLLECRGRRGQSWDTCVAALLPSLIHMTNNRLGVPIPEEAYLGHLIRASLGAEEPHAIS